MRPIRPIRTLQRMEGQGKEKSLDCWGYLFTYLLFREGEEGREGGRELECCWEWNSGLYAC